MIGLTRWCIAHRRWVVIGWVVLAIGTTAIASAVGRNYATDFQLPGTEAQRALNLLTSKFPTQSGDRDTIVFHTKQGTVSSPAVRQVMEPLLARAASAPHVVSVISPYSARGAAQVSRDQRTAFAVVNYDKRANLLPDNTAKPILDAVNAANHGRAAGRRRRPGRRAG